MYRSCIFCSADLGSNDSLEPFPVGRSIAFDGERGRLWAVCPRCARWNLAPLEERWEAIEDAERLFRDTRTRVQNENVGLAKLRDGTRLIRVGAAVPGELAVWRYGESLVRRRRRHMVLMGAGIVATGGLFTAGLLGAGITLGGAHLIFQGASFVQARLRARHPLARLSAKETGDGEPAVIQRETIFGAELTQTDGGTLRLRLLRAREVKTPIAPSILRIEEPQDLVLHGDTARRVLTRGMVVMNRAGAKHDGVQRAVSALARAESAAEYVARTAAEGFWMSTSRHTPAHLLALEMALHEETERRALAGELAALEEMWRQAEEIAAIADRLPDALDPGEPPRT